MFDFGGPNPNRPMPVGSSKCVPPPAGECVPCHLREHSGAIVEECDGGHRIPAPCLPRSSSAGRLNVIQTFLAPASMALSMISRAARAVFL